MTSPQGMAAGSSSLTSSLTNWPTLLGLISVTWSARADGLPGCRFAGSSPLHLSATFAPRLVACDLAARFAVANIFVVVPVVAAGLAVVGSTIVVANASAGVGGTVVVVSSSVGTVVDDIVRVELAIGGGTAPRRLSVAWLVVVESDELVVPFGSALGFVHGVCYAGLASGVARAMPTAVVRVAMFRAAAQVSVCAIVVGPGEAFLVEAVGLLGVSTVGMCGECGLPSAVCSPPGGPREAEAFPYVAVVFPGASTIGVVAAVHPPCSNPREAPGTTTVADVAAGAVAAGYPPCFDFGSTVGEDTAVELGLEIAAPEGCLGATLPDPVPGVTGGFAVVVPIHLRHGTVAGEQLQQRVASLVPVAIVTVGSSVAAVPIGLLTGAVAGEQLARPDP
ncbi:hypothetical protein CBR_g50324 [Chara braunii]|uniref:Uncharacterized protein n=1 Tax=Chara braunii TaxID=69332 RepID=A0A388K5E4_CHABU|nr:hypothetical protein CBR_g50324 [Chara braunii]|eukprot:GBG65282.1 hypothetical protein CBR_g50324 [Chara braunii]